MPEFQQNVVIERPPREVFAFATDPATIQQWIPAIVKIEVLGGGPLEEGAVFRETRMMRKRECSADIRITEHKGPEQGAAPFVHAASSQAAGVLCTYRYTFEAEALASGGEGTRVTLVAMAEPKSFFGKLVAKAMLGMMIKADGDQLERLKAAMEA